MVSDAKSFVEANRAELVIKSVMSGDLARNVILAAFRVQTMMMLISLPVNGTQRTLAFRLRIFKMH
ncbi:hypothetical protein VF21_04202 [Pseudogymnoascus sp. 05NY08]|nr:hypothetical protein VF21_04202 [Pseudogymnoascus sp. 05NY08]